MPNAAESDWSAEEDLQTYYHLLHLLELRTKDRECADAAKAMRALISEVDYLRHRLHSDGALWVRGRAGRGRHGEVEVRQSCRSSQLCRS
jgi:hypothetical protein